MTFDPASMLVAGIVYLIVELAQSGAIIYVAMRATPFQAYQGMSKLQEQVIDLQTSQGLLVGDVRGLQDETREMAAQLSKLQLDTGNRFDRVHGRLDEILSAVKESRR